LVTVVLGPLTSFLLSFFHVSSSQTEDVDIVKGKPKVVLGPLTSFILSFFHVSSSQTEDVDIVKGKPKEVYTI